MTATAELNAWMDQATQMQAAITRLRDQGALDEADALDQALAASIPYDAMRSLGAQQVGRCFAAHLGRGASRRRHLAAHRS